MTASTIRPAPHGKERARRANDERDLAAYDTGLSTSEVIQIVVVKGGVDLYDGIERGRVRSLSFSERPLDARSPASRPSVPKFPSWHRGSL
jgi:hypothetical protein